MPPKTVKKPQSVLPARQFSLKKILLAAQTEATGAKTTSYLITTIATGLIFVLVTLFLQLLFSLPLYLNLVLAFVFALLFSPTRYAMEELIRQVFPGTDYDSHQLVKRLNTISYGSLTLDTLSATFFAELADGLAAPEAAFIFLPARGEPVVKVSDRFQNLLSLTDGQLKTLLKDLPNLNYPHARLNTPAANHLLDIYHIKLVLPLTNNADLVGLMLLGSKDPQKPYTTKDKKVLTAIAPKIGFAVKNAFAYEKIEAKNLKLIADLEQSNQQLRQANKRLRKDDKLKDEFLFIATHELKNPITAMKGYISLIKEGIYGHIPVKLRPPIEQIDFSNEQLIALLNNLLQIARYEAQRLDIKTQPLPICEVIERVITDLKPLSDQKHLSLVHSCQNQAVKVMADRERLHEIMSNLLTNAVKYSDHGTITISHTISQDKLVTHIQDEGVGIKPEDQTKIFTRFFRVEEEAARGIPGSGLGLFIVKKLLEKMNGSIWFTSRQGHGSTFSFALPLAPTHARKHEA